MTKYELDIDDDVVVFGDTGVAVDLAIDFDGTFHSAEEMYRHQQYIHRLRLERTIGLAFIRRRAAEIMDELDLEDAWDDAHLQAYGFRRRWIAGLDSHYPTVVQPPSAFVDVTP